MLQKMSLSRRRAVRPTLDFLEERSLLNAALPRMDHGLRTTAEVRDATSRSPIVPNLPSTPDAKLTTVPASGDLNPYGVALVPAGFPRGGLLKPGQILVANFNNEHEHSRNRHDDRQRSPPVKIPRPRRHSSHHNRPGSTLPWAS